MSINDKLKVAGTGNDIFVSRCLKVHEVQGHIGLCIALSHNSFKPKNINSSNKFLWKSIKQRAKMLAKDYVGRVEFLKTVSAPIVYRGIKICDDTIVHYVGCSSESFEVEEAV
jgi:hypothetical protein